MSVVSSDDGAAASTRKPMKNVSRERMKAETSFLRARVQELERELSHTLAKKALERCTTATPSPMWRDLARRQAARRAKSEQERDRLRMRLLHQLQVAKSLETIFRNRSGAFIDDLCASGVGAHGRSAYPVDNLALLHDQFMDEIDEMYPLVDSLFAEPVAPQDAMETPVRKSTVVSQSTNDGSDGEKLFVELINAVYVPFSFERVCSAMWRAITTEYSRQQRLVEQFRCTDDEFSCTFVSQNATLASVNVTMAAIVMRKFMENDRMVLVWRSLDWDGTAGVKRDFGTEKGWLIVTPTTDPVSGARSNDGAMVRVCNRYVPVLEVQAKLIQDGALQLERESHTQSHQVGEFTNRILNCTEEDIAAITESIENILLDESIGSGDDDDLATMIQELDALHNHPHEDSSVETSLALQVDGYQV